MKHTIVVDGQTRCPNCGGSSFALKRTGKAKWAGAITLGVGMAAMPKRVFCMGCATSLKPHSTRSQDKERERAAAGFDRAPAAVAPHADAPLVSTAPSTAIVGEFTKVQVKQVRPGDEVKSVGKVYTVEKILPGRLGTTTLHTVGGDKISGLTMTSNIKARRPQEDA